MTAALVTGATGFVGHHLVAALRQRGFSVRVLALPGEDTSALEREHGVVVHRGDVRDAGALPAAMRGADVVFHLAAVHGLWRPRQEYEDVNVRGADNVCRAALAARVARLVHVSSWTVYGMGLPGAVREDAPLRPILDAYAVTKARADAAVRRLAKEQGLPAVVVRPGTMFGPGDRVNFGRMADRLRSGKVIVIGSGRNVLPFVYVTDVVDGMIRAAERGKPGEAYNLCTDRPISQREMWVALAEELGAPPPRARAPYPLLYALAWGAEKAVLPGRQPLLTRLGVKLFGSENAHAIDKARSELGYAPRVPVREGVRLAAAWYREDSAGAATTAAAAAS
ncbi:NAD-dependent epimerase/dehydratase family protein [Anaeromyxobacter terrae]|uniref:NAD-dependent epimerase/dehydratase family protein n=1 Tax=Anaeromyxobacter terrae TaxID=2925406 RepID=UPI001F5958E6|nr:NAD-dependent epimerase/dehydratase family protein [Anaeromyxobacter sp. SG22]